MSEATPKRKYIIASVYERDRKLLEFFDKEGIHPGAHVAIETKNYDGTISLSVGKRPIGSARPPLKRCGLLNR